MIKYELTERKPYPKYDVSFEDRTGTVIKLDKSQWALTENKKVSMHKSRTAAFFFFEYGFRYTPKKPETTGKGRR